MLISLSLADFIRPTVSRCPPDMNVPINDGDSDVEVTWLPPLADDNSGHVDLVPTKRPGERFPRGEHVITYAAIDSALNFDVSCRFTVTVGPSE